MTIKDYKLIARILRNMVIEGTEYGEWTVGDLVAHLTEEIGRVEPRFDAAKFRLAVFAPHPVGALSSRTQGKLAKQFDHQNERP